MRVLTIILFLFHCLNVLSQEICDNSIDDDNDGFIDFYDDDCFCNGTLVIEPTSLIPNASFEDNVCIPQNLTEMNCAEGWIQASSATSDYFHVDGFLGSNNAPAAPPLPVANGDAFVGFGEIGAGSVLNVYKEYIGSCLTAPLLADSTYNFTFHVGFGTVQSDYVITVLSDAIDLSFFGNPNCSSIPFGSTTFQNCPISLADWDEIGTVSVSGNDEWVEASFVFTPQIDYNALVIGPKCAPSYATADTAGYFFLDNLVLNEQSTFSKLYVDVTDLNCNNYELSIYNPLNYKTQWYYENIAIPNQNENTLKLGNAEEGNYFVVVSDGDDCLKSEVVFIQTEALPFFNLNEGDSLDLDYGDIQHLSVSTSATDYSISWTPDFNLECLNCDVNSFKAEEDVTYFATLTDNTSGCTFVDSIQIKVSFPQLDNCVIYFPNVFTPNNDGRNDFFQLYNSDCVKNVTTFNVYNRFGERVFSNDVESNPYKANWNGSYKNIPLNNGVFVYTAEIELVNKEKRYFKGNVTLLR